MVVANKALIDKLQTYDVHVIGSGIGGLCVALLLAKVFAKKVCLLEQHWTAGGQTHTFGRKGGQYEWDVGIHYVGNPEDEKLPSRLLRFLSNDRLKWRKLDQAYDRIRYQDLSFDFIAGKAELIASLVDKFPHEEKAIKGYFKDIQKASQWLIKKNIINIVPSLIAYPLRWLRHLNNKLGRQTTAEYLACHFKDKALRNLLASQWGDYGLPPEQSMFAIHALVMNSYLDGGWYPEGGSGQIAQVLLDELEKCDGTCLTNVKIEKIITGKEQGAAQVVALDVTIDHHKPNAHSFTLPIKQLFSSSGAYNTYRKLLDKPIYPDLEELPWRTSLMTLYFSLNRDPRELGFTSSNYWLFDQKADGPFLTQESRGVFLSFPTLKQGENSNFCGEVVAHIDPEQFSQWRDTVWKKRGKDYRAMKDELISQLIDTVSQHYPELRAAIDYRELSTPLSLAFFTQHPHGNMYGVPFIAGRDSFEFCQAKTPYSNLYLCGQDVLSMGFFGALSGSMFSALESQGSKGFPTMMGAIKAFEKVN
ncbi:NAD(P)/FAD-dependent oxidoreductase [Corallincola holothuriorum]|uniref:NAD(P)/FAD-dependent oxidoreductase n=1 Tax=Corallincola holothuriorum TaxID=2282215 RepID=A0A368NJX5_9GAMM|nr:NAD(P)/FAD-dependent oxidoreductase [Corallincola holothuriorum]RCU50902.1 NAD(P)/FAD-dependent oxidoreductase [Corallincola holothuriorum]